MTSDEAIRFDTRLAGNVVRYHTWPTIQNQTIATHTWNLLRIYFSIADQIEITIVYHIIFHDVGEITTGDLPYPIKAENPFLKEQLDIIENVAILKQMEHWRSFKQVYLDDSDKKLVKQIELMEMAEFGMEEVCLGNSHGFVVADRCLKALYDWKPCNRLIDYVILRLDIYFKQYVLSVKGPWDLHEWWRISKWEGLKHGNTGNDNREDQHSR